MMIAPLHANGCQVFRYPDAIFQNGTFVIFSIVPQPFILDDNAALIDITDFRMSSS